MNVEKKLILIREKKGLSQCDIAMKLSLDETTYRQKECGQIDWWATEMLAISTIFEQPIHEIFDNRNS